MARGNPAKGGGVEVARLTVKVSPDTKQFKRELENQLKRINKSVDGDETTNVSLGADTREMVQQVKRVTKDLRATVKVDADVDRGVFRRISERLQSIKGPDFGGGVNGAGMAAIFGGVLAVAAPAMGLLTSALLTLPGLLAAVATPVAAITLGLDGIKKAAERLKEPFEDFRATMNAVNESAFGPVLDKLGAVFPTLERSLPWVSQGMADFARGIADAVTSPEGLAKIEKTISNIGAAISQAAPGIGSFTSGLLTLAEKFSEKMPDLSKWFNGAGDSFQKWIQKLTKENWLGESTLDKAFDGLGGTLKTILDTLGGLATAGMDFFKDPSKINDFNNALKGVGDSLVRITELSDSLNNGNLFSSVMPTGIKLDGGFDFQSVIDEITKPFTSENAPWRDMWAGLQESARSAWSSVTATVSSAVASVQAAVSGIGASISGVWNNVTSTAASAWNGVVSAVQGAWNSIVAAITNGVGQAVAAVQSMGSQVVSAITSIDLTSAGANIVQGLINGIGSMIGAAVAKAKELASAVANAVTGFLGIKSPSRLFMEYGNFTAQGFGIGMQDGFAPVLDQAKALAAQVADAFASGADPTGLLAGFNKGEIDRMGRVLGVDSKSIAAQARALEYQAKLTGNGALKARAQELRMLNDEISLHKDMLGLAQDYTDEVSSSASARGDDPFAKATSGLMTAPVDFAKATASQFMSDIGISGDGLISRAVTEGISYVFNISSVEEAMAIKDRRDSHRARAMGGR